MGQYSNVNELVVTAVKPFLMYGKELSHTFFSFSSPLSEALATDSDLGTELHFYPDSVA